MRASLNYFLTRPFRADLGGVQLSTRLTLMESPRQRPQPTPTRCPGAGWCYVTLIHVQLIRAAPTGVWQNPPSTTSNSIAITYHPNKIPRKGRQRSGLQKAHTTLTRKGRWLPKDAPGPSKDDDLKSFASVRSRGRNSSRTWRGVKDIKGPSPSPRNWSGHCGRS